MLGSKTENRNFKKLKHNLINDCGKIKNNNDWRKATGFRIRKKRKVRKNRIKNKMKLKNQKSKRNIKYGTIQSYNLVDNNKKFLYGTFPSFQTTFINNYTQTSNKLNSLSFPPKSENENHVWKCWIKDENNEKNPNQSFSFEQDNSWESDSGKTN